MPGAGLGKRKEKEASYRCRVGNVGTPLRLFAPQVTWLLAKVMQIWMPMTKISPAAFLLDGEPPRR